MGVADLDRAGITGRHGSDVGHQFCFVENATFLVGEDTIIGEIFFPGRLIAGNDSIVEFLGAPDEFFRRDGRIGRISCACDGDREDGGKKENARFHKI